MKPFFALLGLSFKSLLLTTMNINRGKDRSKRKRSISGVGALVLLCVLMLYISGVYSFSLGSAFATLGALDLMLQIIMLMALFFPIVFILFGAQSMVFSTKDVDFVLSLPVSSFSVMLSRVLAMYMEALLMCEMMLIPAGVAYLYFGGAGGVGFIVRLLIEGVFFAFIPTMASLVFGAVIALVVSRMRFKNLFSILFNILFVVLIMVVSFSISFSSSMMAGGELPVESLNGIRDTVSGIFPPALWAAKGALGSLSHMLLFAAVTLLPFLGITWVFSRFYKSILTRLASHHLRSDYKLGRLQATGRFAALLRKEAGKFFGTPAYVLNGGIGNLFIVIGAVAAVVFRGKITEFMYGTLGLSGAADQGLLAGILLGTICFFSSLTFISCVSISLEGRTLWILKESPVSTGQIFTAKAGFSFLFGGITSLICIPLLGFAFSLPVSTVLLMLVISLLFPLFTSTSGLFINLLFPRMDADNDTVVIKQSASVIISMLFYMVFMVPFVFLFIYMQDMGFTLFALVCILLLLALNGLSILLLHTKGRKLFAEL